MAIEKERDLREKHEKIQEQNEKFKAEKEAKRLEHEEEMFYLDLQKAYDKELAMGRARKLQLR